MIYNDDFKLEMSKTRLNNLRSYLDQLKKTHQIKTDDLLCKKFDLNPSYISQILNSHRNFGEKAAAGIEQKLNIPLGSLSNPNFEFLIIQNKEKQSFLNQLNDLKEFITEEEFGLVSLSKQYNDILKQFEQQNPSKKFTLMRAKTSALKPLIFSEDRIILEYQDLNLDNAIADQVYLFKIESKYFLRFFNGLDENNRYVLRAYNDSETIKIEESAKNLLNIVARVIWRAGAI